MLKVLVYLSIAVVAQVVSAHVTSSPGTDAAVFLLLGFGMLMAFQGICVRERIVRLRRTAIFLGCVWLAGGVLLAS